MIHHAVLKGVSSCCRPGAGGEEQREVFESALKSVDATFQNLDSSEISLTDVSHYFDSDPTKLVSGLRTDGKLPSSYIADTTTANAQVCLLTLNHTVHGLLTLNHTVHGMVIAIRVYTVAALGYAWILLQRDSKWVDCRPPT